MLLYWVQYEKKYELQRIFKGNARSTASKPIALELGVKCNVLQINYIEMEVEQ